MSMRRPSTRILIALLGVPWGIWAEVFSYQNGTPAIDVLRDLLVGWAYLYGGLAIWASRPANATGRLMTFVGLTWFIGNLQLAASTPAREIGTAFADVVFVALIALILAYPRGRLETRLDRALVVVLAIGTTLNNGVRLLPVPPDAGLETWRLYVGLALAIGAYAVVLRRWFAAPARRRSELLPVLVAGVVLMAVLAISLGIQAVQVPPDVQAMVLAARGLAPAAIPLALLVGFYRQSERRQRSLLDAIPDVMLRFGRDGQYLDIRADGSALVTPRDAAGGRSIRDLLPVTVAEDLLAGARRALETGEIQTLDVTVDLPTGRRRYESRITPSGSDEVTAIVRDFTAQRAAEAEQRAAQVELRRSRARIVEAADAERRRLERDLHDGAQQRLVAVSLALRLARSTAGPDAAPTLLSTLERAAADLKLALSELRELARGIHPAILTEAGLGPALETLAARSSIPTTVIASPGRRLTPAIEATAYFVVSEALANVAKHAGASGATVSATCPADSLVIEVVDDGMGGAELATGSGLRGLTDRVSALGGTLSVVSPAGGGTRVLAEVPLAS